MCLNQFLHRSWCAAQLSMESDLDCWNINYDITTIISIYLIITNQCLNFLLGNKKQMKIICWFLFSELYSLKLKIFIFIKFMGHLSLFSTIFVISQKYTTKYELAVSVLHSGYRSFFTYNSSKFFTRNCLQHTRSLFIGIPASSVV